MSEMTLSPKERQVLLDAAWESIRRGLEGDRHWSPPLSSSPDRLQQDGASFVTLHLDGQLRGCIGHLQAFQPLLLDVVESARSAAFQDPRFPPLEERELEGLSLHISVLGVPIPMAFESETDLLGQLQSGEDGLILEWQGHRGTFLPSVWESLPEPQQFLRQLKRKAGLNEHFWAPDIRVSRYRTDSFGDS